MHIRRLKLEIRYGSGGQAWNKHCSLLRYLRKRHASNHHIQRADAGKSGFNAPVVKSGLTKPHRRDILTTLEQLWHRHHDAARGLSGQPRTHRAAGQ
ncbi:hypothetical protein EVAR_62297_1 [Eumeta japonica]|uniref:Uncharacterized protein n=1 Tax=Eumeta variegata TaxID=151549 RepID=A0A4C1ZHW1_EUMVA|nr:hypothetical protein EVAR_62297_1 [Eumeta japonica]